MRWHVIFAPLLLAGCASVAPQLPPGMPVAVERPAPDIERPWLIPMPKDEITLFDTRLLRALRELDETQALNQNGSGRRIRHPGMWAGIGVGAAAGILVVDEAVDDAVDEIGESFFDCFLDLFFGGDCEDED